MKHLAARVKQTSGTLYPGSDWWEAYQILDTVFLQPTSKHLEVGVKELRWALMSFTPTSRCLDSPVSDGMHRQRIEELNHRLKNAQWRSQDCNKPNINDRNNTDVEKVIYLASSQAWYALRSAIWSLWRVPENCLCTQPSLLRSDGVSNGSGKLVLAAIVHIASPQLKDNLK